MTFRSEAKLPSPLPRAFRFRSPLPDAPVEVSADDPENWERYPIGLPHIVALRDEDDRTLYSLRIRDLAGHLIPIRGEAADLAFIRRERDQVQRELIRAHLFEPDVEEAEEIAEAQALLLSSWERPLREDGSGRRCTPWEPIPIAAFDHGDYARFPVCFPFILELPGRFNTTNYCIAWRASRSGIGNLPTFNEDYRITLRSIQMRLVEWLCICHNRESAVLYGHQHRSGVEPEFRPRQF